MSADDDRERLTRADRIALRISAIQTILAVTGFFVGVVALYAALNEADAVRKQQQASVWPHIRIVDMNYGIPGEERFEIIVSNKGIGPARIRQVSVTISGQEQTSWYEIVRKLPGGDDAKISNYRLADIVLAPNEDITAVSLQAPYASRETIFAFRELVQSGDAGMSICYCSVFEDCWNLDAYARRPVPVKQCPEQNPESLI